jgi:quercetin dioxygenase-like cupin family protein
MKNFVHIKDVQPSFNSGHYSYNLLEGDQPGETGVSRYICKEYQEPGVHDFHEGFYVLEGKGSIKCDAEEHSIQAGMSFIVPVNVKHSIKCSEDVSEVKVFWFHIPNN